MDSCNFKACLMPCVITFLVTLFVLIIIHLIIYWKLVKVAKQRYLIDQANNANRGYDYEDPTPTRAPIITTKK